MKFFINITFEILIFLFLILFTISLNAHENDHVDDIIHLACECKKGEINIGKSTRIGDCYGKSTTLVINLEEHKLINLGWGDSFEDIFIVPNNISLNYEYKFKTEDGTKYVNYFLDNYTGKLKIITSVIKDKVEDWTNSEYLFKCEPAKRLF